VKLALEAPAATVTEDGTFTSVLLLERLTARPPLPAALFSVTVQLSVAAPVIEELAQLTAVGVGFAVDPAAVYVYLVLSQAPEASQVNITLTALPLVGRPVSWQLVVEPEHRPRLSDPEVDPTQS
jgi:hypothetical protein